MILIFLVILAKIQGCVPVGNAETKVAISIIVCVSLKHREQDTNRFMLVALS